MADAVNDAGAKYDDVVKLLKAKRPQYTESASPAPKTSRGAKWAQTYSDKHDSKPVDPNFLKAVNGIVNAGYEGLAFYHDVKATWSQLRSLPKQGGDESAIDKKVAASEQQAIIYGSRIDSRQKAMQEYLKKPRTKKRSASTTVFLMSMSRHQDRCMSTPAAVRRHYDLAVPKGWKAGAVKLSTATKPKD